MNRTTTNQAHAPPMEQKHVNVLISYMGFDLEALFFVSIRDLRRTRPNATCIQTINAYSPP